MNLQQLPSEFTAALPILEKIEQAGYEAYFVGGSVRDTLLGKPIHDVDIATSAFPEEIKAIFDRTIDTGIQHGTVMILDHGQGYETTTFRTESTYTDFRRPDEVTFVRSLAEDLQRRDFTINAFALKADGEIIDLFDGLTDLKNKTLRAVGSPEERFHEDALRMMRALRFSSQLSFEIEPATLQAIQDNVALLKNIAIERINVEFTKMMLGSAVWYAALEMIRVGMHNYLPGLQDTDIDIVGLADLLKGEQISNATVAWMFLAFELGLTATDTNGFLRLWKHSNDLIKQVRKGIHLLNELRLGEVSDWDLYEVGDAIEPTLETLALSELMVDDTALRTRYANLPIKNKQELAINGGILASELGLKPGPVFGKLLQQLEMQVVGGQLKNERAVLIEAAHKMIVTKK